MPSTRAETLDIENVESYKDEVRVLLQRLENITKTMKKEEVAKLACKNVTMRVQGLRYLTRFCNAVELALIEHKYKQEKFGRYSGPVED